MKPNQSLMNIVERFSSDFLFDNFKKVVNELNFKDGMNGSFYQGEQDDEDEWIKVIFDNSWQLTILYDDEITLEHPNLNGNDCIYETNYENLLKFMERKGIRKNKECSYKDAELYIIDFGK